MKKNKKQRDLVVLRFQTHKCPQIKNQHPISAKVNKWSNRLVNLCGFRSQTTFDLRRTDQRAVCGATGPWYTRSAIPHGLVERLHYQPLKWAVPPLASSSCLSGFHLSQKTATGYNFQGISILSSHPAKYQIWLV